MESKHKKKHKKNKNKKKVDEVLECQHESDERLEVESKEDVNITQPSSKRSHSDSDSENETVPKKRKKKKKKSEVSADQPSGKNKKSNRQAKREKFAQRQAESNAAVKDQIKSECLNYLSQWKHNKQNWKFMKAKQVWLYKNKFSEKLLPSNSWPLLLEYFESAKGNIRNMLLDDANKIIKQMDDWTESQNGQPNTEEDENKEAADEESKKPSEAVYKRARELIQFLGE